MNSKKSQSIGYYLHAFELLNGFDKMMNMKFLILFLFVVSCASGPTKSRVIASLKEGPSFACGKVQSISEGEFELVVHEKLLKAKSETLLERSISSLDYKVLKKEQGIGNNHSHSCLVHGDCEEFSEQVHNVKYKSENEERKVQVAYITDTFLCVHPADKSYTFSVRREL